MVLHLFFGHITPLYIWLFEDSSLYHDNATEPFCKDIKLNIKSESDKLTYHSAISTFGFRHISTVTKRFVSINIVIIFSTKDFFFQELLVDFFKKQTKKKLYFQSTCILLRNILQITLYLYTIHYTLCSCVAQW